MSSKKYQLEHYRKYLLNRLTVTASPLVVEYVNNCLASEDEGAKHTFHKIMVRNWTDEENKLYDVLSEYFQSSFIPVNYTCQGNIASFYTSSLSFVMKIIKLDYLFPYDRNMFYINVSFNDKTSADCFENRITIDEIVAGVLSSRMNGYELDLSNFSAETEFTQHKINFYKISLLSQFKILMLRLGKETKVLNLSNNNLSTVPMDILNFFIKGDLTAINLSNNNIQSKDELHRVSSKVERLWLEGNPLCDEIDPVTYVKQIVMKFPRLKELDGVPLNKHGLMIPFFRNFLIVSDKKTRMVVEKFISLYFTHYDTDPRKKMGNFYAEKTKFSITFTEGVADYATRKGKVYSTRLSVDSVLAQLPPTVHDTSTFTVDVLRSEPSSLLLVVDGVFKHKGTDRAKERLFSFRRAFMFEVATIRENTVYHIVNDMWTVASPTLEQLENSFQKPIRNMNSLALINPEPEEAESICRAFAHVTQLKREEVLLRLKINNWDIRKALAKFKHEVNTNMISKEKFAPDEDDFSDSSSLVDDID